MILRKHKRKMFWPIVLLILAIVPLAFFHHIATDPRFHQQQTMEINLPPLTSDHKTQKMFYPDTLDKWRKFSFSEDDAFNDLQLKVLRQEVKSYMKLGDTIQGIRISLNRQMSYDRFVKTIDMLNLENVTRFAIWHSNVWLPKFPRKSHLVAETFIPICGGCIGLPNKIELSFSQRMKHHIQDYSQYFQEAFHMLPLSVFLVWLLLLLLNIFQILNKRLAT
jgi:biopolymer transport protein ExbD